MLPRTRYLPSHYAPRRARYQYHNPRPHQQKRLNHPLASVRRSLFASSPLLSCLVQVAVRSLFPPPPPTSVPFLYLYELPLLALFFFLLS